MSPLPGLAALVFAACASVTAPRAESVTEIAQERDCSGCDIGTAVTLRHDGTATLRNIGKERFRTSDRSFTGIVARADFDRLAALLISRGFFDMRDEYRDPTLADGSWISTTAVRDGRTKTVLDANEAGPEDLRAIESAIEAVRAAITWTPANP
jgi:hypothetical protein